MNRTNVPDLSPRFAPTVKVTDVGISRICLVGGTLFWQTVQSVIGRTEVNPSLRYTVGLLGYLKKVPIGYCSILGEVPPPGVGVGEGGGVGPPPDGGGGGGGTGVGPGGGGGPGGPGGGFTGGGGGGGV